MTLPQWDWSQTGIRVLSVAVAYVLALPIGWNWEKIRHNSGLRTFPLVAVASCCYVLVAKQALGSNGANLDRVIQGLMTGIGFIGGGAIFRHGANVYGTSTAASVWCVGALGAAVACGAWDIAILLGAVNIATLQLLRPLKEKLDSEPSDEQR